MLKNLGRGHRKKIPYVTLRQFITKTALVRRDTTYTPTIAYPIDAYVNCDWFSDTHKAFFAAITSVTKPKTYAQAVRYKV